MYPDNMNFKALDGLCVECLKKEDRIDDINATIKGVVASLGDDFDPNMVGDVKADLEDGYYGVLCSLEEQMHQCCGWS